MNVNDSLYSKIELIRKARDNRKLVLFVGAGVSTNSGLPSWGQLIEKYAKILTKYRYQKNERCENHFCSDEYLKIPQYVYDKNKSEYKRLLKASFGSLALKNKFSNELHKEIIRINPAQIITTNYDNLLESADVVNASYFTVVSSDKELLENGKTHNKFIIKMHGDCEELDKVVLREDDYLRYEQEHLLISTYIKSLLVTHTFVFVGYSLNDYNFKQIIDWIEYLSSITGANKEERITHYLIKTGEKITPAYEETYLKKKHIEIIDVKKFPAPFLDKHKAFDDDNTHNNQLYAALKSITDATSDGLLLPDISQLILRRYQVFDDLNFIPYQSLMKAFRWKGVVCEPCILVPSSESNNSNELSDMSFGFNRLHFIGDNGDFEILNEICENNPEIKEYFRKADIFDVYVGAKMNVPERNFRFEATSNELVTFDIKKELFLLYINNEYDKLKEKLTDSSDERLTAYYEFLLWADLQKTAEKLKKLRLDKKEMLFWDIVDRLNWFAYLKRSSINSDNIKDEVDIFKMFFDSLTENQKIGVEYIYELFVDNKSKSIIADCYRFLEKHTAFYKGGKSSTDPFSEFKKIAQQVLCYYKFIKLNFLILDDFSETCELFFTYSRALLISYKFRPKKEKTFFFVPAKPIKIDNISLDIIVKYSKYNELREFIINERLNGLDFNSDCKPIEKFVNLCKSNKVLRLDVMEKCFCNFALVLCHSKLSAENQENIIRLYDELLNDKTEFSSGNNWIQFCLSDDRMCDMKREFYRLFISLEPAELLKKHIQSMSPSDLSDFTEKNFNWCSENVKEFIIRQIKEKESDFWEAQRDFFIINNWIQPTEKDYQRIIHIPSGDGVVISHPDKAEEKVYLNVLLFLQGKICNIEHLKSFSGTYPYINAILDLDSFRAEHLDYTDNLTALIFENETIREKLLAIHYDSIKMALLDLLNTGAVNPVANEIFYLYFFKKAKEGIPT